MQSELEETLFELMRGRGYGDDHVARYQMVTAFYLQRRPLIIFICGSCCTGAGLQPTPACSAIPWLIMPLLSSMGINPAF